jgi:hypothetical protein
MGRIGLDGIRALAAVLRDFAHQHPHRYELLFRAPIDHAAYALASGDAGEALAIMVRTAGVPEARVQSTQLALFAAVHGYVSLEITGFLSGLDDLETIWVQVLEGAIATAALAVADPATQPAA